jgi:hypothetical protein
MIIIGSLLVLGVIALALIPTPEEQAGVDYRSGSPSAINSNPSATSIPTSGTQLGNLNRNLPDFTVVPSNSTGVIEGTLTYLYNNDLPEGTKVCAVNQQSFLEICTSDFMLHDYYLYGVGYRVAVAPGEYTVYAQAPGEDFRAYYTPFVECGHREGCDDHTPRKVMVQAGAVVTNVDPNDWAESPLYQ